MVDDTHASTAAFNAAREFGTGVGMKLSVKTNAASTVTVGMGVSVLVHGASL